jgi:Fur family ferric uptake transcriptional regulator
MIPSINKQAQAHVLARISSRLAGAGYRLTHPRQAVLRLIVAQVGSFTAGQLLESASAICPDVGRATVFRTLDLLISLGILQRVHTESDGNWGHSYVLCGLDQTHHHHLVCTHCGLITDFAGCGIEGLLERLSTQTSFKVESHHIELYGLCERCQSTTTSTAAHQQDESSRRP